MRDGLSIAFVSAMVVVALAPREKKANGLQVQTAWLAQRESALGDWESVRAPLREGDELQLTVSSSEDAFIYVLDREKHVLLGESRARAHWQYAIPGPHVTWRLDGAAHDRMYVIASRHRLTDPVSELSRASHSSNGSDLELPLRDGRIGSAITHIASGGEVVVDRYDLR
jgi:hypothetical protein